MLGRPLSSFNGAAAGWPRKALPLPNASCHSAASMGPRPDGRGRAPLRSGRWCLPSASMGPRPDGRGRRTPLRACRPPAACFNGAAAGWPRKELASANASPRGLGFNGAAAGWPRKADGWSDNPLPNGLQWGRGRMAAEGGPVMTSYHAEYVGFNGAAAGWPRKGVGIRDPDPNKPLQWGRGRMAAEGRRRGACRSTTSGFNGAAAGWPRKVARAAREWVKDWGFNGAAAGWPRKAGRRGLSSRGPARFNGAAAGWPRKVVDVIMGRLVTSASMGPRPDGRGRPHIWCRRPRATSCFNGAAAGWPRKGALRAAPRRRHRCFNGAAAGWPRKAPSPPARRRCCTLLQWGRGRMAAEGVSIGPHCACAETFNGAAAGWPRKGRMNELGFKTKKILQWGRGRMAAEGVAASLVCVIAHDPSMGPRPDGRGR